MVTQRLYSYMVDTDWAVFYLRGREPFVSLLKELRSKGLALSIISVGELFEGVFRAEHQQEKEAGPLDFLSGVGILEVNMPIARLFGQYRAELRQQGSLIGELDLLIGCTAVHHGLPLLTENTKHLGRIPGLRVVSLDDLGTGRPLSPEDRRRNSPARADRRRRGPVR